MWLAQRARQILITGPEVRQMFADLLMKPLLSEYLGIKGLFFSGTPGILAKNAFAIDIS